LPNVGVAEELVMVIVVVAGKTLKLTELVVVATTLLASLTEKTTLAVL
jgi:hypothetical protein